MQVRFCSAASGLRQYSFVMERKSGSCIYIYITYHIYIYTQSRPEQDRQQHTTSIEVTTHIAVIQPTQPKAKPVTQNVLIPQFIWRYRGMVCIAVREANAVQVAAGHLDTSVQSDGVYDHEAIIAQHPCAQWGQGRPEIHLGEGVGSGQNLQL